MTRPTRLDPIAVPFAPATRQRVATLRDVPTLHVARDPRDVIGDAPPCARTIGVEAYRRQVDAMALDPSHGIAQAEAIREERRKAGVTAMADELRLCGAIDGPPHLRESIAALLWARLQAEGVL